jgi:hypothetical protein
MTLQELLKLLEQADGSAGPVTAAPATAASTPATPGAAAGVPGAALGVAGAGLSTATGIPGLGLSLEAIPLLQEISQTFIDPLFGLNPSPLGFLGPLGDWIAGGIPRSAKSGAIGTALESSGNPLDALIGQYVGKGVAQGDVLSESGPSNFETDVSRFAAMVEALTGLQAPEATATGFNHNPTWENPAMARAIQGFQLPPGYEFVNDPSKLADVYKDIASKIGMSASNVYGKAGQRDWTSVVQELISQGALTKYGGPMGAAGAQNTSAGAIPNISLPHPLAQNQPQLTPPPYPL